MVCWEKHIIVGHQASSRQMKITYYYKLVNNTFPLLPIYKLQIHPMNVASVSVPLLKVSLYTQFSLNRDKTEPAK